MDEDRGRGEADANGRSMMPRKAKARRAKDAIGKDARDRGFYVENLSDQERADLASESFRERTEIIDEEIALMKVVIRRALAGDRNGAADLETVRRCVDTLVRAVRARRALRQGAADMDEALPQVLKELMDEIEAGKATASTDLKTDKRMGS